MEKKSKRDLQEDDVDVDDLPKAMERASPEELQARKIRRPNYHKGMKSASPDSMNDQEKTGEERNPFAAVFLKHKKESEETATTEATSKAATENFSTSANEEKPESPVVEKKSEDSEEKKTETEKPQAETNPFELKNTNPFAQMLAKMSGGASEPPKSTDEAATPFASSWKIDHSFTSTAMRHSEPKAEANDQSEDDLAQEEPADEAHELSVPEDEVVVARCHVKAFRFDAPNKTWSEIGPGIMKLSVHKELHEDIDTESQESNFGRVLFHDSRNRVNRMNFPLGESFKISPSQGNQAKNLIFTTAVSSEGEGKDSECQTYLVKPTADKASNADQGVGSGIGEFRRQLETYNNSIITRSQAKNKA